MFINQKNNLQKSIIEILSKKQGVTAKYLFLESSKKYKQCSIQAIYKELRKLQEKLIVVKINDKYSLSFSWILNTIKYMDEIYDSYIEQTNIKNLLATGSIKQEWKFSDLRRLDDLWIQILLSLFHETKEEKAYCWVPHPWFELVHHKQDVNFQKALKINKNKQCFIIGGNTYLDQYFASKWPKDIYEFTLSNSVFDTNRRKYLNVVGDYIFSFVLDRKTTDLIDSFFEQVKSAKDINVAKIVDIFDRGANIKATLERDTIKAGKIKRKIIRYSGF
jgi:hypothetical protein